MGTKIFMDQGKLKNMIESMLLVSKKPLLDEEIQEILDVPQEMINRAVDELIQEYQPRGINIFKLAGGYQLGTNPENSYFIDKLVNMPEKVILSPSAIETLAIIAYKQPITKPEVELIRGVDSSSVLDTLISRRLISEAGRSDQVGRPYLYATTDEFLLHFGLKELSDMPALPEHLVAKMESIESRLEEDAAVERKEIAPGQTALEQVSA